MTQQSSLLSLLAKTDTVSDEDSGGLVENLDDVHASVLGGGLERLALSRSEPGGGRDDAGSGLDTEEVGGRSQEGGEEFRGNLGNGEGLGGRDGLLRSGSGGSAGSGRSDGRGRGLGRRDEDVDGVSRSLGLGDQRSGEDGSVVNLVVAAISVLPHFDLAFA